MEIPVISCNLTTTSVIRILLFSILQPQFIKCVVLCSPLGILSTGDLVPVVARGNTKELFTDKQEWFVTNGNENMVINVSFSFDRTS